MTEIICELATNFGGNLNIAKDLIAECADAGATWVKTQAFKVKHLSPSDPQYDWFKQCELSEEAHAELIETCQEHEVKYLTTVFNAEEVAMVQRLGLRAIKVGSGEAEDPTLQKAILDVDFDRVFVSLGMSDKWTDWGWPRGVRFLHCVSLYPTPQEMAELHFIEGRGGYSDHCKGIDVCKVAVAMGAKVIEKHVSTRYCPRQCAWDATPPQIRELRQWADFCNLVVRPHVPTEHLIDVSRRRFIGRWQYA